MNVTPQRIRLAVPSGNEKSFTEKLTNRTPFFWRGTDIQFELAIFYKDELLDVSNLTSLTLEVKPFATPTDAAVMTRTVDVFNAALVEEGWDDDSDQHCVIPFTHEETAPDIGSGKDKTFWLVISAINGDGEKVTLGVTTIKAMEDGTGSEASPAPGDPEYLTAVESAALFMPRAGSGSNVRFKEGEGLQWYDPDSSPPGWRTQVLNNGAIGWGDPEA